MAFFEMVRRYWPVAVLAIALGASHFGAYRFGATVTQTQADLTAAELAEKTAFALAFAQAAARGEEQRRQIEAEKIQSETTQALEKLQDAVDSSGAVVDRLRGEIKRYASASGSGKNPGVPDSPTGAANPENMLAVVLDQCVTRVRELAAIADSRGIKRQGAEELYNSVRSPAY